MSFSPEQENSPPEHVEERPKEQSHHFRFKKERDRNSDRDKGDNDTRRRRHHPYHNHARHKRRKLDTERSASDGPSSLSPDVAFRESLFDALGDDEGAEFWQGVYGQPIHTYSRTYEDADTGELETMNDEQYATYVRRKMWEKSAEGIEATRRAKHQERTAEEAERRRTRSRPTAMPSEEPVYNNFSFNFELEASLRRGERRKEKKRWLQIWQEYLGKWKDLQDLYEAHRAPDADNKDQVYLRNNIAWPVESGKRKDLVPENIEKFIVEISAAASDRSTADILKSERVRWHPDKIQQRYGFMNIEESTMKGVTSVFQVLDRMWNEYRKHER